jgi:hypothetical protein
VSYTRHQRTSPIPGRVFITMVDYVLKCYVDYQINDFRIGPSPIR